MSLCQYHGCRSYTRGAYCYEHSPPGVHAQDSVVTAEASPADAPRKKRLHLPRAGMVPRFSVDEATAQTLASMAEKRHMPVAFLLRDIVQNAVADFRRDVRLKMQMPHEHYTARIDEE